MTHRSSAHFRAHRLYMYVYQARDGGERLCAAGGALRRPHMIAAASDVFPAHSPHTPYPLPDAVDHSTLATTQRMLLTLRAYPIPWGTS